jgi:hypothetical protein
MISGADGAVLEFDIQANALLRRDGEITIQQSTYDEAGPCPPSIFDPEAPYPARARTNLSEINAGCIWLCIF